jgi:hypothetical protein
MAALAAGTIAEPAAAKVTFAGIGGVQLSMSEADLTSELGSPSSSVPARNPEAVTLRYRSHKLEVLLHRGMDRVVGVYTTSRAQRTTAGLGVGSSTPVLRARLRGEKCGVAQDTAVCSVERSGRVMDFSIRRGKVFRVAVTTTR